MAVREKPLGQRPAHRTETKIAANIDELATARAMLDRVIAAAPEDNSASEAWLAAR